MRLTSAPALIRLGLIALLSLFVLRAGATTFYIDWVGGSDSNNGTSTATPWKRCPGMNGFSGSYTHIPGDRFIFKGGVTWPNSAFQLRINSGGNSESNRDYYGVDTSWFTGGAWSKPIFDGEHVRVGNIQIFAAMVGIHNGSYITIDRIHFRRLAATSADYGSMCITVYGPVFNLLVTGCEFSDWLVVKSNGSPYTGADAGEWDNNGLGGFGTFGGGHGWTGSIVITNCVAHQSGVSQKSGTSYRNAPDVRNCEAYNTVQGVLGGGWVDGCHIHDFPSPTQQNPVSHCNAIQIFGPTFIRNNIIHDLSNETAPILVGVDWCCQGQSNLEAYIYNNVLWNTGHQTPIGFDAQNGSSGVEYYIWNNTVYSPSTWPIRGERGTIPIDYVEMKNNHLITNLDPPYYVPFGQTVVYENNVRQLPQTATDQGYVIANEFRPTDSIDATIGTGQNLSASFTTDRLGVSRSVPWDVGAYEFVSGGGSAGTILLSTSTMECSEDDVSVGITLKRISGSTGSVSIDYDTQNGTASSGVNYTTSSDTLTWANGDSADKTVLVPVLVQPFNGSKDFKFILSAPSGGATLGSPSTNTITITGTADPPPSILPGLSWPATNGVISSPFINSNYVWQASQILDPTLSGRASYTFTNLAGTYLVKVKMKAPDTARDSIFINFNDEPTSPTAIWDVQELTSGFEDRYASWRGSGTFDDPEFPVKTWQLPTGTNTLIIRGREAECQLEHVTVELQSDPSPIIVDITSSKPNGHYKAGVAITNLVTFSTNVVVAGGTPTMALNSGGTATYTSGSGSTVLEFVYTVQAGEDAQDFDYDDTTPITLNGATIQNDGVDADLTAATPGQLGSISNGKDITVDTTAPTVDITGPSGGVFTVTYTDTNFSVCTLREEDVTLSKTGTADGSIVISTPGSGSIQTVQLVNTSGSGQITITIPSGTATDLAGNSAPGDGPSDPYTITRVLRVGTIRAGQITTPP